MCGSFETLLRRRQCFVNSLCLGDGMCNRLDIHFLDKHVPGMSNEELGELMIHSLNNSTRNRYARAHIYVLHSLYLPMYYLCIVISKEILQAFTVLLFPVFIGIL